MLHLVMRNVCVGLLWSSLGACVPPNSPATTTADFAIRDTEGRTLQLTDYLGREAVVLFFFSTSSRSCLPLMPHLTRWSEERRGDVVILGIAMDGPDTIAEVPAFRHRHNVTFPVGLDDDSHVARLYNPRKADPFLVFIDWRGNVIGIRDGYIPGDERDIQETISRAVRPP